MAVQYRRCFSWPRGDICIMVRGVFQVQERANNERISDFLLNSTLEEI